VVVFDTIYPGWYPPSIAPRRTGRTAAGHDRRRRTRSTGRSEARARSWGW